jgi:hypothetical protein
MMPIKQLLDEIDQLPQTEKWRLVRHLLDTLEQEKTRSQPEGWHDFIDRMYGALADDPIERPPQLPLTDREPID